MRDPQSFGLGMRAQRLIWCASVKSNYELLGTDMIAIAVELRTRLCSRSLSMVVMTNRLQS